MPPLDTRYQAAMLLSGVGDSLGYKNGKWMFCSCGSQIYEELQKLGGVNNLDIRSPEWKISSYTLLNIRTAIGLTTWEYKTVSGRILNCVAKLYKTFPIEWGTQERHFDESFVDLHGKLNPDDKDGVYTHFDSKGISSAAAVRGMCIGMRHASPDELQDLIKLSIEIGWLLNPHPLGFLGTMATALFTSYALQRKPVNKWGRGLIEALPAAKLYVEERNIDVQQNLNAWHDFEDKWRNYVKLRGIESGENDPVFPCLYGIKQRECFYKSISDSERPGRDGCDSTIIAYDVFLSFDGSWEDLCVRSICHSGFSNVTCSITACWYGAMFGYNRVEKCNYSKI